MIDVDKMKINDFMKMAETSKCAAEKVAMIRRAMSRSEDDDMENMIVKQMLTPEEIQFAIDNYYLEK